MLLALCCITISFFFFLLWYIRSKRIVSVQVSMNEIILYYFKCYEGPNQV